MAELNKSYETESRVKGSRPQTSVKLRRNKNIAFQVANSIKTQISKNASKWKTQVAISQCVDDKISAILPKNMQILSPHMKSPDDKILIK